MSTATGFFYFFDNVVAFARNRIKLFSKNSISRENIKSFSLSKGKNVSGISAVLFLPEVYTKTNFFLQDNSVISTFSKKTSVLWYLLQSWLFYSEGLTPCTQKPNCRWGVFFHVNLLLYIMKNLTLPFISSLLSFDQAFGTFFV